MDLDFAETLLPTLICSFREKGALEALLADGGYHGRSSVI